ncbi:MAG TPA: hypothetical protein DCX22_00325 [Dehalococcoidia bacterium]|nr:hypothetical protein [Dehalococcoidia bacterium]
MNLYVRQGQYTLKFRIISNDAIITDMIEQILSDLYRDEIPLPRNPLKALNWYIIKTADRFLVIDTGMNREECKHAMFETLRELG